MPSGVARIIHESGVAVQRGMRAPALSRSSSPPGLCCVGKLYVGLTRAQNQTHTDKAAQREDYARNREKLADHQE
jgi:hypothetical protein